MQGLHEDLCRPRLPQGQSPVVGGSHSKYMKPREGHVVGEKEVGQRMVWDGAGEVGRTRSHRDFVFITEGLGEQVRVEFRRNHHIDTLKISVSVRTNHQEPRWMS